MNLITRRYLALDRHGMGGPRTSGSTSRFFALFLHPLEYVVFYAVGLAVLTLVLSLLIARRLMKME
ncbi:hypothetical protein J5N58_24110 [Rhizobium cremeum]|uniref:hypothetical protein n=1 Tax=Rhizobium cremeum TaxID=2813827 RepID=UPI000DDD337D|nr:hypothetical protein [Rhizobium cremeum]MCJ7997678.1 hypothetical protein [Rhizobium cremeum]MCJ8002772.1 hypothetical protein [Rhizobium cremeum]